MKLLMLLKNMMKTKKYELEKKKQNNQKKKNVNTVIDNYNKYIKNKNKTLILCHGKKHQKKFIDALTLNRNKNVSPNLVLSAWKETNMELIPNNYFDFIIMEHCPLDSPFENRKMKNSKMWKNLYRILKENGKIINSSLLSLYSRKYENKNFIKISNKEKQEIKNKMKNKIKKLNFTNVSYNKDPNKEGYLITTITK